MEHKLRFWKFGLFVILIMFTHTPDILTITTRSADYSPCCSYPCLNGGLCIDKGDHFVCDCSRTGYYGKLCATESWSHLLGKAVYKTFKILLMILQRNSFFKNSDFCHAIFYQFYVPVKIENIPTNILFGSAHDALIPTYNSCVKLHILPPVPKNCPTSLGNKGPKEMPSVNDVYGKILKRDFFKKNRRGLNILFAAYGLHFNLQFSRCSDINVITCAHIYEEVERSYQLGKLKHEIIHGEEFPVFKKTDHWFWRKDISQKKDQFVYHNIFTYAITTIWTREHNKICTLLHHHWPNLDDEHLFHIAKNIITGEILVITMTEWLHLFGDYKLKLLYKPKFAQYGSMFIANILPVEMYLLLNWPTMLLDNIKFNETLVNLTDSRVHTKLSVVHRIGLYNIIKSFVSNEIGMMSSRNSADSVSEITKNSILEGRKLRLPSFNQYRSRLGLKKLKDFSEITSCKVTAKYLKELYDNIDAIEFIPGILIEESLKGAVVGETMNNLFSNWLFKSLITHPIGSKPFWKPHFMGGFPGWEIVQRANLRDLICRNINQSDLCYDENKIGFKIPGFTKFLPRTVPRKRGFSTKKSIFAK